MIVVSKLGLDQFDAADLRLLEVLAGHVSVALVECAPLRGPAAGGRERKGVARAHARALGGDEPRRRARAGRPRHRWIMGPRRCSVWLPTFAGGLMCRASEGDSAYAALQGRTLEASVVARCSGRSEPFVLSAHEAALVGRALDARELASPHAVAFIPIDYGLAALAVETESDVAARELELLAGIASQARLAITNAGSFATLERTFPPPSRRCERARGEGLLHVVAHPLDPRHGDRGREGARPRRGLSLQAARARRPVPRHREDRSLPDPHEARAADRRGALADRAPSSSSASGSSRRSTSSREVRPIVRACHERYDGAGYPDRLAGDEIPSRRGSSSPATPSTR